jgi:putative transposase
LILLVRPSFRDLITPTLWGDKTLYVMLPDTRSMKRRPSRPAHLVFIDECGFMLEPVLRKTWAPRGHTPVIKIADPHGRISAAGALTISPLSKFEFYFHLLPDNNNFRGNSIAAFVNSVRFRIGGPLTIIWDQIPIHKSYPVKRYVSQHDDIFVESFPPYAPELNPVDYVWAYVKYGRLANYCPKDLDQLRTRVSSELSRVSKRPDLLKSFFHATGLEL